MYIIFVNAIFKGKAGRPLGLASLCTVLKKGEHVGEVIDFTYLADIGELNRESFLSNDLSAFADILLYKKPDVLSFYCMSNSFQLYILLAQYIRQKNKEIIIILAGPQVSLCAKETLLAFPYIDIVAIGEGEMTINALLDALSGKMSLCSVPNICYRIGAEILSNACSELVNVDELDYIDYDFVPWLKNGDEIAIEAGRGCPFCCTFCSTKTFWKQSYRLKSAGRLVDEIEHYMRTLGKKKFLLEHDSLTANKSLVMNFCQELIKRQINITWTCSSRVDLLDKQLIDLMFQSGCRKIFMGIESGSPRIQKLIKKNIALDKVKSIAKYATDKGILITCSFICGYPYENHTDLQCTFSLIKKLYDCGRIVIQLHSLSVLSGTDIYEQYKNDLVLTVPEYLSDVVSGANTYQYIQLAKDYPSLFPHLYVLKCQQSKKTHLYGWFVSYVLNLLAGDCKNTYQLLMRYFNQDLLLFFTAMESCIENFSEHVQSLIKSEYEHLKGVEESIRWVKSFIISYGFESLKRQLSCVFELESNMILFKMKGYQYAVQYYDFDVIEYIQTGDTSCFDRNEFTAISVMVQDEKITYTKENILPFLL